MSSQLSRFEMAVGNESGDVRGWKSARGRVIRVSAQLNSSLFGPGVLHIPNYLGKDEPTSLLVIVSPATQCRCIAIAWNPCYIW